MPNPALAWLERDEPTLAEDIARRLCARAGSVFKALGHDASLLLARELLTALRRDLDDPAQQPHLRELLTRVTEDLLARGLGYADLRLLSVTTRQLVLSALAGAATSPEHDPGPELRALGWLLRTGAALLPSLLTSTLGAPASASVKRVYVPSAARSTSRPSERSHRM